MKEIKILLASPRGFCAGVVRAIEIVEKTLNKFGSPVYVRHEIVHNKHVVDDLKKKGAIFVEKLNEIKDPSRPVIFSAHGVPKNVPEEAKNKKIFYIDATCPLVTKVHKEAERHYKNGLTIILIGHKGHPEVVGTMGQIPKGKIILVETINDVEKIKINEPIAYVTQTTLSVDDTADIIDALKKKYPSIKGPIKEDICYATTNRQEAVKDIAKKCDYFFVLGSKNSSNSLRLVEVAKNYGSKNSILIDDVEKFDPSIIKNKSKIGITASASSPEILVKKMLDKIKQYFELNIIESNYEKEDIHFKIPQKLKEVV